jgi:glutamate synthase domain-containing protein 2
MLLWISYFTGTVSRMGGIDLAEIVAEVARWHQAAFADPQKSAIESPGFYKYKRGGESHAYSPASGKGACTRLCVCQRC